LKVARSVSDDLSRGDDSSLEEFSNASLIRHERFPAQDPHTGKFVI